MNCYCFITLTVLNINIWFCFKIIELIHENWQESICGWRTTKQSHDWEGQFIDWHVSQRKKKKKVKTMQHFNYTWAGSVYQYYINQKYGSIKRAKTSSFPKRFNLIPYLEYQTLSLDYWTKLTNIDWCCEH